jgi:hypothetical protein
MAVIGKTGFRCKYVGVLRAKANPSLSPFAPLALVSLEIQARLDSTSCFDVTATRPSIPNVGPLQAVGEP